MIAAASVSSDVNVSANKARLNYTTGSLTYGDRAWWCKDDFDYQAFAVMEKLNLSNASNTFQLEYRSDTGTAGRRGGMPRGGMPRGGCSRRPSIHSPSILATMTG